MICDQTPAMAKERPILFSTSMVHAILEGRKTQTRRAWKLPRWAEWDTAEGGEARGNLIPKDPEQRGWYSVDEVVCPYGQPGDRIVVKETFYAWGRWITRFSEKKGRDEWHFIDMTMECGKQYRYAADHVGDNGPRQRGGVTPQWWKRPAIFMPRRASRLLLEIIAVRVERLNDISRDDAEAEGVELRRVSESDYRWIDYTDNDRIHTFGDPRHSFWSLWKAINGTEAHDSNPWVWVVEFRRVS